MLTYSSIMVNTTRGRILELLRAGHSPVSGEKVGRALGLSRVAVWKHVQALVEAGYTIDTGKTGYLLLGDGDFLYPWEFLGREHLMSHYERICSTMEEAGKLPAGGNEESRIVVAEEQTSGRGRLGRVWDSARGGLYFTLRLNRRVPLAILGRYPLLAAAVLAETLNHSFGIEVRAKWPNDILATGRKIAGVLLDFRAEGDETRDLSIGIGVNVTNPVDGTRAASLSMLTGRRLRRRDILSSFAANFDRAAANILLPAAASRWRSASCTLGRNVTISLPGDRRRRGRALDVTEDGALVVREAGGKISTYHFADCRHR